MTQTHYRVVIRWPNDTSTWHVTAHPDMSIKEAWCPDHGCPQAERVIITRIEEEKTNDA